MGCFCDHHGNGTSVSVKSVTRQVRAFHKSHNSIELVHSRFGVNIFTVVHVCLLSSCDVCLQLNS